MSAPDEIFDATRLKSPCAVPYCAQLFSVVMARPHKWQGREALASIVHDLHNFNSGVELGHGRVREAHELLGTLW